MYLHRLFFHYFGESYLNKYLLKAVRVQTLDTSQSYDSIFSNSKEN